MNKINKKELHEIFINLRKKQQDAYNKLYENYYKLIYGIVFSILKNKDDSEDITHEIFTKIYKLDVNKLPTNNESSWLFTVSKNECYLYLRKSKPNINIEEIYEIPESLNYLDEIIDIEYYNKLIKGLKEDEKLIVSLKVLSNFTFNKIAQIMNIPIGTVQWKYYKAINSLKISVSSLVGAVIAFVIVVARGEFLKNKMYLNKNSDTDNLEDNQDIVSEENNEAEDNVSNQDSESIKENDGLENNENVENSENNNQVDSEVNDETQNVVKPDNNITTNKNEQNVNQETVQSTVTETQEKLNKIDGLQVICLSIGIICLSIFITFLKIYQQKLRKRTSK